MLENLDSLFTTTDVKQFVKQFRECEETCGTPNSFLEQAAGWLSVRTYERHYDLDVPHSFFGLAAAASVLPLFPEERQWWPVVQQAWHAARSRKRSPWPLPKPAEPDSNSWATFQQAVQEQDFTRACAVALGLALDKSSRDSFRRQSLKLAMGDASHGGLKFLYLAQCWKLAEHLNWKHLGEILFPPLHFLIEAGRDSSLAGAAVDPARLPRNGGDVDPDDADRFEKTLLFSESTGEALQALSNAAAAGAGLDSVWETLQIAAAQAVANSKLGSWRDPARAFIFASLARETSREWQAEERLEALTAAAALIHRASLESREKGENRDLEEVARRLCPTDAINTLRSVVSHSDPVASATAAIAAMGMDDSKKRELLEALAQLAAKNDGQMGQGYDLLLVQAAVDGYRTFRSPAKDKLLSCCAFFLGRLKKSYQLFGAYGVK